MKICVYLSLLNIYFKLGVSEKTVKRNIIEISNEPIYTKTGRCAEKYMLLIGLI